MQIFRVIPFRTLKVKKNVIYWYKTQHANFQGNPLQNISSHSCFIFFWILGYILLFPPWYNCNGLLGVKHPVTYLSSPQMEQTSQVHWRPDFCKLSRCRCCDVSTCVQNWHIYHYVFGILAIFPHAVSSFFSQRNLRGGRQNDKKKRHDRRRRRRDGRKRRHNGRKRRNSRRKRQNQRKRRRQKSKLRWKRPSYQVNRSFPLCAVTCINI